MISTTNTRAYRADIDRIKALQGEKRFNRSADVIKVLLDHYALTASTTIPHSSAVVDEGPQDPPSSIDVLSPSPVSFDF